MKTLEILIHEPARSNAKFFYVYSVMCQVDGVQFEKKTYLSEAEAEKFCKEQRESSIGNAIYWVLRIQVFVR